MGERRWNSVPKLCILGMRANKWSVREADTRMKDTKREGKNETAMRRRSHSLDEFVSLSSKATLATRYSRFLKECHCISPLSPASSLAQPAQERVWRRPDQSFTRSLLRDEITNLANWTITNRFSLPLSPPNPIDIRPKWTCYEDFTTPKADWEWAEALLTCQRRERRCCWREEGKTRTSVFSLRLAFAASSWLLLRRSFCFNSRFRLTLALFSGSQELFSPKATIIAPALWLLSCVVEASMRGMSSQLSAGMQTQ